MIGSWLILLTSVFMNALMLIWSILVLKCIEKFRLKMSSIMEWAFDMSTYAVFRVSDTSPIVELDIVESFYHYGRRSRFL